MLAINTLILLLLTVAMAAPLPQANTDGSSQGPNAKGDKIVLKVVLVGGVAAGCIAAIGMIYFAVCKLRRGEKIFSCGGKRKEDGSDEEHGGIEMLPPRRDGDEQPQRQFEPWANEQAAGLPAEPPPVFKSRNKPLPGLPRKPVASQAGVLPESHVQTPAPEDQPSQTRASSRASRSSRRSHRVSIFDVISPAVRVAARGSTFQNPKPRRHDTRAFMGTYDQL